jgi:hypothetical protein
MKLFVLIGTWFLSAFALGDVTPPGVYLRSVSHAGSACPHASLNAYLTSLGIVIISEAIVVESGPGVPLIARRKHCQVNLDLAVPNGWSYAIDRVESTLFMSLEAHQKLTYRLSSYNSSQAAGLLTQFTLQGPQHRDVHHFDSVGLSQLSWSPCRANRSLNLKLEVLLDSTGNDRGLIVIPNQFLEDDLLKLSLKWKRC